MNVQEDGRPIVKGKTIMAKGIYVLRRPGKLDAHGQPIISDWNAPRVAERSIDELLGICKGLIADRSLSEEEVYFLVLVGLRCLRQSDLNFVNRRLFHVKA